MAVSVALPEHPSNLFVLGGVERTQKRDLDDPEARMKSEHGWDQKGFLPSNHEPRIFQR